MQLAVRSSMSVIDLLRVVLRRRARAGRAFQRRARRRSRASGAAGAALI